MKIRETCNSNNPVYLDVESVSSIDTSVDQNFDSGSGENSDHSESSDEFEDLQDETSNEESDTKTDTDPLASTFIDPFWSSPLYADSNVSILLAVILISSFKTTTGLTRQGLQNLLDLILLLMPGDCNLPKTAYLFEKVIPPVQPIPRYFCPYCSEPLTESETSTFFCHCKSIILTKKTLVKERCYYLHFSIEEQIRRFLQDYDLGEQLVKHTDEERTPNKIRDIYDGTLYRSYRNGMLLLGRALSLIFNTDGAPVFNSSTTSMWPGQCLIAELPPYLRKKFIVLSFLWIGPGKPTKIDAILRGMVDELKRLSSRGFQWLLNGELITSTVDLICVSVDSIARAPIQNFIQFNGRYGCPWCLHPGKLMKSKSEKGVVNAYFYKKDGFPLRTKRSTKQNARLAKLSSKPVLGVKSSSILNELPFFDIISAFVGDSLHCIDQGVMKQLADLWFSSSNSKKKYYIGKPSTIELIDSLLLLVRPPSNITRLYCSLFKRVFWKGSEWRNFLFYYGPLVLKDILPLRFYNHFLLLSEAVYTLSQKEISYSDVRKAIVLLEKFVEDFERLYGIVNMTFNVHQLLHLGQCVYQWGPLWVYSTYTFEDNNGNLLKMFNGTQAVDIQIAKKFVQCQQLKGLTRKHMDFSINPEFLQLQQRLLGEFVPTKKAIRCHGGAVLMGASTVMVLSITEIRLVKEMSNVSFKTTARSFKKLLTQKDILTVVDFHINKKKKRQDVKIQLFYCRMECFAQLPKLFYWNLLMMFM